jgi:hypothetical protein
MREVVLRVRGASPELRLPTFAFDKLIAAFSLDVSGEFPDYVLNSLDVQFATADPQISLLTELSLIFGNLLTHFSDRDAALPFSLRASFVLHEIAFAADPGSDHMALLKNDFCRVFSAAVLPRAEQSLVASSLRPIFASMAAPPRAPPSPQEQPTVDATARLHEKWRRELEKEQQLRRRISDLTRENEALLRDRGALMTAILGETRKFHTHKDEDQADRRNLRLVTDLMAAIDEANYELQNMSARPPADAAARRDTDVQQRRGPIRTAQFPFGD